MANISQGRGLAMFFGLAAVLFLLVVFRPGDQSAAAVDLGDPTAWVEHGIDGELLQISSLTGDITSRVEVAEPGEAFVAFPHGDGAVVLNTSSSQLSLVSGSELVVTNAIDLPLSDGADSRDVRVFGQVDSTADVIVVDDDQVLRVSPVSGDVFPITLGAPIDSLVQDGNGEVFGLDRSGSAVVQLNPNGPTVVAPVTDDMESEVDERSVVAAGGRVFALDPVRLSLSEVLPERGLDAPICMRSTAAGAVHGGSGPSEEAIIISLNASSSTLGVSSADGSCRDLDLEVEEGEYGPPVAYGGVAYIPFWSDGRILSIDLETGETLADTPFGTQGQPFELEIFGSSVWANERIGPVAAVVRPTGIVPVVKVSTVIGSGGVAQDGDDANGFSAGEGEVNGLRILGDEGDEVMSADAADSTDFVGDGGNGTEDSALFDDTDQTEPPQPDGFGIPLVAEIFDPVEPETLDELEPLEPNPIEPETPSEPLEQITPIPNVSEDEETPVLPLEQLLANFTVSAAETTVGEPILFTDVSSGSPASWSWTFGDGSTAQDPVVDKAWNEPGEYEVTLTVTNGDGQSSVQGTIVRVLPEDFVLPPNADFQFSSDTIEVGESIRFESTTSGDVDILEWDFGNGRTAVGEIVTHAFDEAGTYKVSLTATNEAGSSSSTLTVSVIAGVEPPVAAIAAVRTVVVTDQMIRFESVSLNEPTRETWNFGDGSQGSGTVVRHSFSEPGEYRVALVVENSEGTDRTFVDITVEDRVIAPVARFGQSDTSVLVGEQVSFSNASLNGPTEFRWFFGDGNVRTEENPRYSWDEPGTYRVLLRVENSAGSDQTQINVTVENPVDPPEAAFSLSTSTVVVGQDIVFTDESTNEPTEWLWNFERSGQTTVQNPFRRWETPGTYTVRLTVRNAGGQSSTETEVTVVALPTASFRIETVDDDTFRFIDQSQNADGWRWDFGDGSTSNEQNPTHTFAGGSFRVRLTTTNDVGSSPTTEQTVTVSQPPVARASCEANGRSLVCSAGGSERAVSYQWSANGAISNSSPNGETTTFQFDSSGRKEVTLVVTSSTGETDTATVRSDSVEASRAPRVQGLRVSEVDGERVTLQADFDRNPEQWEWRFNGVSLESGGDGPTPTVRVTQNGTYSGTVVVRNSVGSNERSFEFTVDHFDEGPERPPRVLSVRIVSTDDDLVNLVADFDRDPESWQWGLDGAELVSGGDTNSPTFRISANGTFSGFVEASNARGSDRF